MKVEKISYSRWEDLIEDYGTCICDICNGTGCGICRGSGEVLQEEAVTIQDLIHKNIIFECLNCFTEGCHKCNGIGYMEVGV